MAESKVRVGLVGAGPWANLFHGPMLSAGSDTELVGVWARRPEAARETAGKFGVQVFEDYDQLLAACDGVAIAVAPRAQPALAERAARAGKALLLEKPLADDLAAANQLVNVIRETGVLSQVVLTYRYMPGVRELIGQVAGQQAVGGRVTFIGGGLMGGPFAFGWRLERGVLLDLGPHVLDLAEATLGTITKVMAHGDPLSWVGLLVDHEGGARSEISISGAAGVGRPRVDVEVYTREKSWQIDALATQGPGTLATIQREFADMVRSGKPHSLDASHALRLQRFIAEAESSLGA